MRVNLIGIFFILMPGTLWAEDNVSTSELPAYIAACADGASINIDANLSGSIKEIFGDGGRVAGDAAIGATSNLSDFLSLFAESDRPTMYKVYIDCIRDLVLRPEPKNLTPEQTQFRNDVLFYCLATDRLSTQIAHAQGKRVDPNNLAQILGIDLDNMVNPLGAFDDLFIGQSGSIYREASQTGDLVPMLPGTEEQTGVFRRDAREAGLSTLPFMVLGFDHVRRTVRRSGTRIPMRMSAGIILTYELELAMVIRFEVWEVPTLERRGGIESSVETITSLANCAKTT